MGKNQVLRTVKDIDVKGRKVLVRLDLDVPLVEVRGQRSGIRIADDTRLINTLPTIKYLLDRQAKVTMVGHLGRPLKNSDFPARSGYAAGVASGRFQISHFSLEPVREWYREKLKNYQNWELWENLRFDLGEEANSLNFSEDIVRRSEAEVYVFEAFATAHEPHASVISVPKLVRETVVGFRFGEEIRNLSKIWQNPKRPVVIVLGGAKVDTKIGLIPKLAEQADEILVGGLLPTKIQISDFRFQILSSKLKVAELDENGLDISQKSAEEFADIIMRAGTVVWNGPMGVFEKNSDFRFQISDFVEENYKNTPAYGTYVVAKAMRETGAFTVAGGGDTEAALTKLGGAERIDWVSSGGGAMLYYLAHHTLPFLEAIK